MASIREEEDKIIAMLKARRRIISKSSSVVVGLLFVAVGVNLLLVSHAATSAISTEPETGTLSGTAKRVTDSSASGGQAVQFGTGITTGNCTVTTILTNPCRPWLGGESSGYAGTPDNPKDQDLAQEARIGRQLDMVHTYHPPGSSKLTTSDLYFINRSNTILEADWMPGATFAAAGSSSNDVNIDKMAASIKAVTPKKIILSLWHEPEDDVTSGMSCTPVGQIKAGSPTDFINMYHHIHDRFAADGVTNVVWAINYMGASKWDSCLIKQLWPGNSYVDWIFWDPYSHDGNFDNNVGRFYTWLMNNSDSTHDFKSKAFGIAEWNIYWSGMTRQQQIDLYNSAKSSVEANRWPNIKAYEVFDSLDQSIACYPKTNKLLNPPVIDTQLLGAYKAYANSAAFTNH